MTSLLELAERCEKATGADWRLSRDIFKAIGGLPDTWFGSKVEDWFGDGPYGCNTVDGIRHLNCLNAPSYTGSIDAAVMTVPSGFYWHIGHGRTRDDEPLGGASIIAPFSLETISEAEAPTVALALCAAALRARSITEGDRQP